MPALDVRAEQRGLIEEKLAELEVMMAKLSVRQMEATRIVRPDTEGIGRFRFLLDNLVERRLRLLFFTGIG